MSIIRQINQNFAVPDLRNSATLVRLLIVFINQFVYLSVDDGIGCALSGTDFPTFFMGLPRHPLNFTQGLFLTGICAVPASLTV